VDTDRNLLFGVLALQADLIDDTQFARACSDWAAQKEWPLADLLVERGWLTGEDRADVERLLERKLKKHKGDARASLAEAAGDPVKRSLAALNDAGVRQSLAGLTTPPQGLVLLSLATTAYEPGGRERYTLSRLHATGGIGRVWLARDASLGRDVALKELRPERASNPAIWARFLREAQVTGQLEHPGIVPVYELGRRTEDQQPFYTMRFFRGRTLAEAGAGHHRRRAEGTAGPLEQRELLTAFVGVCNAVAYAHSRGVLHRDLKPQNVVLGDYGEVMVLDWGLAKVTGQADDQSLPLEPPADEDAGATVQGQVLGTPAYMAPEQAEGRLDLLGPATDVYGMGAILYEILTGAPPFVSSDTTAVLRRVVHEQPARPRAVDRGVPPALEAVCLKALAKKPGDRYASAKALADDVQRWLADEPVAAYREPLAVRAGRWARHHRTAVSVAAALLVAGAAALGVSTVLVSRQRARAEANFELARAAVDDMYTQVAEKWLAQESRMEPVQRDFLIKALRFYEQFAQPAGSSREVRLEGGKAARRVGTIQTRLGDNAAADAAFHNSIDTFRALAAERPDAAVRHELQISLNRYAWLLWTVGRSADDALREARELGESLAQGPSPPIEARVELATTYSVQAIVAMAYGRFAEAGEAHAKALPLREAIAHDAPTVENREAIGRSLYHRARFFQRTGKFGESEAEFNRAVEVGGAVVADAPREPRPRSELANDLIERAGLFTLFGRPKDAEADLRRGLALADALVADFPSFFDYRELQAALRRDLASLLNDRRQTDEARRAYAAAIEDGEALVKECPDYVSYRWNLCVHLSGLMTLEWSAGHMEEAEGAARRALELAEEISARVPGRLDYKALVAHRRFELADLLSNFNRKPEAKPIYERCLVEYEELVHTCPVVPEYRHSLTQLTTRIGDRYRAARQFAEAEAFYDRSLPLAEGLAREFPEIPSYRLGPVAVRTSLAKLAVFRRDAGRARELLDRTLGELDAELKKNSKDDYVHALRNTNLGYLARAQAMAGDARAAAATAAQLEEFARASMERFNAACYLALLFKDVQDSAKPGAERDALINTLVNRSIAQLRKAKAAGLQGVGAMLDDTDFDPIRTREEFQAFRREVSPPKPAEGK
jgi:serine/threonine-protein kinase